MSIRKVVILFLLLESVALLSYLFAKQKYSVPKTPVVLPTEKIYVAIENDGKIAVINPQNYVVRLITLDQTEGSKTIIFMPHNVQVSPDGKSIWVTANVGHVEQSDNKQGFRLIPKAYAQGADKGGQMNMDQKNFQSNSVGDAEDEVIVIDPLTDNIVKRIPLGKDLHLAHVVLTSDDKFAYVSSQNKDFIAKIDARGYKVLQQIPLKKGSSPHGIRLSPDESRVYVADMGGGGIDVVSTETNTVSNIPVQGKTAQIGIALDGKFVMATVFDTKKLAVYDVAKKSVFYIDLPSESKGPVQVYPMPDSRFVFVADQGFDFNLPSSDLVYKIDLYSKKVISQIKVGKAPYGVVVSKDGKFVYVSNLASGDVSIIDTLTNREVRKIKVGSGPNGISVWTKNL